MSGDIDVRLDNSSVIRDLTALGTAVDTLTAKIQNLDRHNLSKVRAEFASLKNAPLESVRELAAKFESEFDKMHTQVFDTNLPKHLTKGKSAISRAIAELGISIKNDLSKTAKTLGTNAISAALDQMSLEIQTRLTRIAEQEALLKAKVASMAIEHRIPNYQLWGEFSPFNARLTKRVKASSADSALALKGEDAARAMLGLPSAAEFKNLSALLGQQMKDRENSVALSQAQNAKYVKDMEKRTAADMESTRIAIANSKARTEAARQESLQAGANAIKAGRSRGVTDSIAGNFSNIATGQLNVHPQPMLHTFRGALRGLAGDMNTVHSAARGLASGFGALWLTWGAMIPLLTGAALSYGFTRTVKMGSEVQQELKTIGHVGENSAQEVSMLNTELLRLASIGPFAPIEIAKALKVLSLAGLEAKEQMSAIKDVLNFSIAGTINLDKGAETLVAIATAFGYSAKDFGVVGDIISKTAAVSMSSVESMGESFKMASVVAQEYRVSITDVSTSLALLANIGIRGTSAGTATRQMYNELLGSNDKVRKHLKKLGVDATDAAGGVKPLALIIAELSTAIEQYPVKQQNRILQDLTNERGMKATVAALEAYRKKLGETGKTAKNELARIQKLLDDAPGFMAIAAIGMAQTAQNQMKGVGASLQGALVRAFETADPYITTISDKLRSIFNSDGFVKSVKQLTLFVGELIRVLVDNLSVVVSLAKAYITFKVTMMAIAGLTGVTAFLGNIHRLMAAQGVAATAAALGTGTLTAQVSALGVASGTAAIAMRGFQAAMGWLAIIGGLLAAGVVAWQLYKDRATESADEAFKAKVISGDKIITSLQEEIDKIEKTNLERKEEIKLLKSGVDAHEAASIAKQLLLKSEAMAADETRVSIMRLHVEEMKRNRESMAYALTIKDPRANIPFNKQDLDAMDGRIGVGEEGVKIANRALSSRGSAFDLQIQRLKDSSKEAKQLADELAALRRGTRTGGDKNWENEEKKKKRSGHGDFYRDPFAENYTRTESERSTLRDTMVDRVAEIDSMHKADLKSTAETEYEKFKVIYDYESKTRALLKNSLAEDDKTFMNMITKVKVEDQSRLADDWLTKVKQYNDQLIQVDTEATKRYTQNRNTMARENASLIRSADKFIRTHEEETATNQRLNLERDALKNSRPEELAALEAKIEVQGKFNVKLRELEEQLKKTNETANASMKLFNETGSDEAFQNWLRAIQDSSRLKETVSRFGSASNAAGEAAAISARNKSIQDQADAYSRDFKDGLSDAVATGIMEGGAAGGKKLRSTLEEMLIRRPFKIILEGIMNKAFGSAGGDIFSSLFKTVLGAAMGGGGAVDIYSTPGNSELMSMYGNGLAGNRASGGPVNSNSAYRVNELGMEMLSVGNRDYLLTGNQRGNITPAGQSGTTITYAPVIQIDSRTDQAQIFGLVDRAVKAGNAKLVEDLKTARAI